MTQMYLSIGLVKWISYTLKCSAFIAKNKLIIHWYGLFQKYTIKWKGKLKKSVCDIYHLYRKRENNHSFVCMCAWQIYYVDKYIMQI